MIKIATRTIQRSVNQIGYLAPIFMKCRCFGVGQGKSAVLYPLLEAKLEIDQFLRFALGRLFLTPIFDRDYRHPFLLWAQQSSC